MIKESKKKEIYKLLVGIHPDGADYHFSASRIAKVLGVSRQYIHRTIKEFESKGIIKCDTPKAYIKIYSGTYKSFESAYKKMSTKSEPSSEFAEKKKKLVIDEKSCVQKELIVQKARYEILIKKEYIDFFKDKKTWMHGNCRHFKWRSKVFDQLHDFQFEKVGRQKLVLVVPEMMFRKQELSIAKHCMFAVAYEALKWFAKEAKIEFDWGTMHLCQKPHITRSSKKSKVMKVAKDWSLSIDGRMLDMSSGKADWEAEADSVGTKLFDDSVIDAVDSLETWDAFSIVKSDLEDINVRLYELEGMQPKINEKVDDLLEGMKELKEMMQPLKKPLDHDDPAFS